MLLCLYTLFAFHGTVLCFSSREDYLTSHDVVQRVLYCTHNSYFPLLRPLMLKCAWCVQVFHVERIFHKSQPKFRFGWSFLLVFSCSVWNMFSTRHNPDFGLGGVSACCLVPVFQDMFLGEKFIQACYCFGAVCYTLTGSVWSVFSTHHNSIFGLGGVYACFSSVSVWSAFFTHHNPTFCLGGVFFSWSVHVPHGALFSTRHNPAFSLGGVYGW